MKKFSIRSLKDKDIKIVQKKKIFLLFPLAIVLIAIIFGVIYGFTTSSPLNLGMDFTGGYTITIRAGALINDDNFEVYKDKISTVVQEYKFEHDDEEYPVRFEDIQRLGAGTETSLRIQYRADRSIPRSKQDTVMEKLNDDLVGTLNEIVGVLAPISVDISGNTAKVIYDHPVKSHVSDGTIKSSLIASGIALDGNVEHVVEGDKSNFRQITFNFSGTATAEDISSAVTINRYYSAQAISGDMISGTVSTDLIKSAILAIVISLLLMLVYIFIRFEFSSGIAAVSCLIHDIVIMFSFMVIFRIEINSTFIAALVTILGYSINNTIILFDRIREIRQSVLSTNRPDTATDVANKGIKDTLTRTIYTTITTSIMIGMIAIVCAIGGIFDMVNFALPIMFGLIAGLYSTVFMASSFWVIFKRNSLGVLKQPKIKDSAKEAALGAK